MPLFLLCQSDGAHCSRTSRTLFGRDGGKMADKWTLALAVRSVCALIDPAQNRRHDTRVEKSRHKADATLRYRHVTRRLCNMRRDFNSIRSLLVLLRCDWCAPGVSGAIFARNDIRFRETRDPRLRSSGSFEVCDFSASFARQSGKHGQILGFH